MSGLGVDLIVGTAEAMERLGERLASRLRAGDLVFLNGELGAGKTTLARGIGAGLGVRGAVTSPTFVLARTHPRLPSREPDAEGQDDLRGTASRQAPARKRAPLVHVDAYRLGSPVELDDLDIDFAASIVVVEWGSGMLEGASESWLSIDIDRPHGGEQEADDEPRAVRISGHGARWQDLGWLDAARD